MRTEMYSSICDPMMKIKKFQELVADVNMFYLWLAKMVDISGSTVLTTNTAYFCRMWNSSSSPAFPVTFSSQGQILNVRLLLLIASLQIISAIVYGNADYNTE